jgi:hypothetical protein
MHKNLILPRTSKHQDNEREKQADRVVRRSGYDASWPRVGGCTRRERVHQRVDELDGACAEHDVLVVDDGVTDGLVQPTDEALQLS